MSIAVTDIAPLSEAWTQLSALASEAQTGKEKNGEGAAALIGAERLDRYHRLERAHIHLLLLHEIERGLADVAAGCHQDAREVLKQIKHARANSASV